MGSATTLVAPCNLSILEGTFRKPNTTKGMNHRECVTVTSAQSESSHSMAQSYTNDIIASDSFYNYLSDSFTTSHAKTCPNCITAVIEIAVFRLEN